MHYFGGSDANRIDRGEHYVLNLDNPSAGWQTRAAMPNPRSHMAGAVIGGKLYAIGGCIVPQLEDSPAVESLRLRS